MKSKVLIAALFAVGLLSACDNRPVVYQQQPQVVQQAPVYAQPAPVVVQQDNGAANLATGLMLGHMMANGQRSQDVQVNRTVVNKTVIVNNHPAPAPVVAAVPTPAPSQTLMIPPKSTPPAAVTSYAPRNVVTPTFAPAAPRIVPAAAPAPRPSAPSYAPSRSFTTSPTRTTSVSSFKR